MYKIVISLASLILNASEQAEGNRSSLPVFHPLQTFTNQASEPPKTLSEKINADLDTLLNPENTLSENTLTLMEGLIRDVVSLTQPNDVDSTLPNEAKEWLLKLPVDKLQGFIKVAEAGKFSKESKIIRDFIVFFAALIRIREELQKS